MKLQIKYKIEKNACNSRLDVKNMFRKNHHEIHRQVGIVESHERSESCTSL